jgi:putative membrane protein
MAYSTLALAVTALPAVAQTGAAKQDQPTSTRQQAQGSPASAEEFVKAIGGVNIAEVQLGKLAAEKGSSQQVKQFGQRMVNDHATANDELKAIAGKKNITLPTAIDAKHKAEYDRLSKLSGEAFDREYIRGMVEGHQEVLADFRQQSQSGQDAEVKAFAAKTLPTIEAHLEQAQSINQAVATSGSGTAQPKGTSGTPKGPSTTTPAK